MMRALYLIFVAGCLLLILTVGGPLLLLGILGIAALRIFVWEHWERLERRQSGRHPAQDP
jgi:hypothetical protein